MSLIDLVSKLGFLNPKNSSFYTRKHIGACDFMVAVCFRFNFGLYLYSAMMKRLQ